MRNDTHTYPTYKLCSIPQICQIPSHWEVKRLAQMGTFSKGGGGTKDDEAEHGLPCIRYGDIYTSHKYFATQSRSRIHPDRTPNYARIKYGDVLFAGSGETIEDIGKSVVSLIEEEAYCGGDVILFRPTVQVHPRFMGYTLDSPPFAFQKSSMGRGITIMHIYSSQLKNMCILLPPLDEQAAIVRYLDHANELINRYITAKERLIALLEEQRQAVIHRAIARGLDPDVKLKDSGVEWLGEVPEHWEVRRIKSLTAVKRGASPRPIDDSKYFSNNGEYAWVRIADVTASNHFLETTTQKLSKLGQSLSVQLQPGALFMSIAGSVGKPMITKIKCCIHDGFVYFPSLVSEQAFMYQILSTSSPFVGLGKFATQLNLNTDTVGGIHVPYPPISERRQITAFLEDSSAKFDKAISQAQHQIDLMNEYRTRLIADVVTGQLDVRDAAVELHV